MGLTIRLASGRTATDMATFTVSRPAESGPVEVMLGMEMPLPAAALLTSRGIAPGEAVLALAAAADNGRAVLPA